MTVLQQKVLVVPHFKALKQKCYFFRFVYDSVHVDKQSPKFPPNSF